ncbi:Farnesylcysteine lyase [Choanephora cucurbitarum]|uniref:Farnesylcysteine lyase n=1 Tax=Choanephora cucurbitarum TaxID=101091 RepID=A0A1C7NC46_9FUNG|nr:Farnesylcysteine lyase [Choanephora cucurbitarum]
MKHVFLLSCLPLFTVAHVNNHYQHVFQQESTPLSKSVAIIGGGAAGTSTAFWLNNVFSSNNSPIQLSMTIFDRNSYLGGRSTTVPIKGDASRFGSLELGASIFVDVNKNLIKATDVFGLKRITPMVQKKNVDTKRPGLGVWNGDEFLFEESGGYWDNIKALWRYGLSPLKFQAKQKQVVQRFLTFYEAADHGFESVSDIVDQLDYKSLLNMTAEAYLKTLGINERFTYEILQSATRGNYCQDLNALHALAVMVSMEASHGTWAVEEGNYRIFEEFASRSQANIQLNTKIAAVYNITELDSHGQQIPRFVVEAQNGSKWTFDDVVIASPLKYSGIELSFPFKHEGRDYHTVHVTLVAGYPNHSYFGRTAETMPSFVVTTGEPLTSRFKDGKAPFDTFSVHRVLENGEDVTKIFSAHVMTDELLDQMFLNRSWTYHKGWHAFPSLHPVTEVDSFPSFVLKPNQQEDSGIIYASAFENFISTMETQTIAGKNAARLLYEKWCSAALKQCQPFGDGWGSY